MFGKLNASTEHDLEFLMLLAGNSLQNVTFFRKNPQKVLPVVHIFSLTIMTYLKMVIGIKSLNTKQYPARLSPPHVKLSSFIGGRFSPKKRE